MGFMKRTQPNARGLTRLGIVFSTLPMSTSPDLKGALEAMKAAVRGPRRKSPVYEWLAARYDPLTTAFRTSQPAWKALAVYLGKGGVMGADGIPATAAAVRATWLRVQADKERRRV